MAVGIEVAGEPAGTLPNIHFGICSLPNIHRMEVAAVRIGVADAGHDGQMALVIELVQRFEVGVQSDAAAELNHVAAGDADGRAQFGIVRVGIRDDSVQAVIAAGHLDDDQYLTGRDCR